MSEENKTQKNLLKELELLRERVSELEKLDTDRKKAEERLRYFQKAIDNASDAIGMSTPEGRHYYQNEAMTKLFGLNVEEVQGEEGPPSTVYVDEKIGREVFETIMRGDSWTGEVQMFGKDRKKLDIFLRADSIKDETGKVIGLIGMHTDMSECKLADEELKRNLEDLKEFKKATIDRENLLIELKREVNRLSKELGRPEPYDLSFLNE